MDEGCFERVMVDVGLIQARWFEGPLLDGGEFQSFFPFPHRKERVIHRLGKVVEWVEHFLQNLVLHKEDHGCL